MNAGDTLPRFAHCLLFIDSWCRLRPSLWSTLLNWSELLLITSGNDLPETIQLNLKVFVILIIASTTHTNTGCPLRSIGVRSLLIDAIYNLGSIFTSLKSVKLICENCGMSHMMPPSTIILQTLSFCWVRIGCTQVCQVNYLHFSCVPVIALICATLISVVLTLRSKTVN